MKNHSIIDETATDDFNSEIREEALSDLELCKIIKSRSHEQPEPVDLDDI